jgi:hypothetical protein
MPKIAKNRQKFAIRKKKSSKNNVMVEGMSDSPS